MIGAVTFALVLGLLCIGVLRSPAVAIAGVLCIFGLEQWGMNSFPWLTRHGEFTNLSIGGLVVLGIALRVLRGQCLLCVSNPVATLVLALYALAFCSVFWGPDTTVAFEYWRKGAPYLMTIVVLVPLLVMDLSDVRRGLGWSIGIGAALCMLALVFGQWGHRGLLVLGDVYSMETNPLAMASMAGTVFVAAMLSFTQHRDLRWRLLLAVAIPAALAVMLKSGSRGQLIAACFAAAAAWPIAYPQRKSLMPLFLWLGGLALIAAVGWWLAGVVELDAARWDKDQTSADVSTRLDGSFSIVERAWRDVLTLLFGLGNSSAISYLGYYPHVTALEVLAEEGVVGFVLFAFVIGLTYLHVSRLLERSRSNADDRARGCVVALAALFVFELLLTFKQGTLLSSHYVFAYAIILARLDKLVAGSEAKVPAAESAPVSLQSFPNLLR